MIIKVSEAYDRNRDVIRVARRRARAGNDSHLFRDNVIVAPLVPSSLGSIRSSRRFDVGRRRRRRRLPASLPRLLSPQFSHSLSSHLSLSLSGSAIVTGAIRRWWWWTDRKAGGGENSESACLLVFTSLHLGGFQLYSTTKFPFFSDFTPFVPALARSHRHHEVMNFAGNANANVVVLSPCRKPAVLFSQSLLL